MENRLTIEYLAGFFDGEGTFYIGKQYSRNGKEYPHATIMLSQSGDRGLEILSEIQKKWGGFIYEHLKAGQHKATKSAYKLYWNKQEGVALIKELFPHLILKQEEAKIVLTYLQRKD